MFTGIITDLGKVTSVENRGDRRLAITTRWSMADVAMGASIACSGVCLTVVEKGEGWFAVDVSAETLACTTVGEWKAGTTVNLERALRMGDELGGHIVSGHVDGLARVISIEKIGDSHGFVFEAPTALAPFIAAKGSVALDGISLTVNSVDATRFTVNIIPHTWQETTVHTLTPGSRVNLEIDMLARYVSRMMEARTHA